MLLVEFYLGCAKNGVRGKLRVGTAGAAGVLNGAGCLFLRNLLYGEEDTVLHNARQNWVGIRRWQIGNYNKSV
jgi:hypothetical protein